MYYIMPQKISMNLTRGGTSYKNPSMRLLTTTQQTTMNPTMRQGSNFNMAGIYGARGPSCG
jgi:hypothetical protein